ncbi:hypothetical protein CC77DRAFT_597948 [Alternaria alternata]|uniref:Uncharacterized protein n=1 Tax=Alternaria alternata TaxID=5599 RepID=A0A177D2Y2_ALTAL|nr:hypothetical protein CC77DRAFT_597948 [Alternaria alternata]OAG13798.1 hypothetical protein CC77DRAFT_597948 [Alternaria alternata]
MSCQSVTCHSQPHSSCPAPGPEYSASRASADLAVKSYCISLQAPRDVTGTGGCNLLRMSASVTLSFLSTV